MLRHRAAGIAPGSEDRRGVRRSCQVAAFRLADKSSEARYGVRVLADATAPRATIPQRLDRLPLTWTLWRLALVTQAGWALVVATDAIAARIYPFVWGPRHAFDTAAFSILLLVSTGAGIVAGEYLFAWLSDRFGRRRTLLAAAATCGLGTLPSGRSGHNAIRRLGVRRSLIVGEFAPAGRHSTTSYARPKS